MVLSRSISLAFRRYPSKINLIRGSFYPNCFSKSRISEISKPIFSNLAIQNGFKSIRTSMQKTTKFYHNCFSSNLRIQNGFKSIRNPIQNSFSTTRFYHNCLSESRISRPNTAIQGPFLNGAKRFYDAARNEEIMAERLWIREHLKKKLQEQQKFKLPIKTLLFSLYILTMITPVVFLNENFLEIVPFSKRTHYVNVSIETETEVGQQFFEKNVQAEKILPSDHPYSIRVQGIANNIIEALHRLLEIDEKGSFDQTGVSRDECQVKYGSRHLKGLRWEVVVVDSPESNAWSAPGGKIVMYTALLEYLSSKHLGSDDDGIAFIMAHEVAHVVARHKAEKLSKFSWLFDPMEYLLPACIVIAVAKLFVIPLTLRTEIEADYIGLLLMASAGYDPRRAHGTLRGDGLPVFSFIREILWSRDKVMQEAMDIYIETIRNSSVQRTTTITKHE